MSDTDDLTIKKGVAAVAPGCEHFAMMVQQVKDFAILMLDTQGYIKSWNLGAQLIKGYSAEEVIGRHFSILFPEEDVSSGKPGRELDIARGTGSLDLQEWRVRKDGSRFWANITITALYDEQRQLVGYCKIVRDVTERRRIEDSLQKSRNMFERLFETSPDSIVVVDNNGTIRKVNQQTEVLFGLMRDELIGDKVERLMPERYRKAHRQHIRNYFRDPRARKMGMGLELYGQNRDGKELPLDILLTPIEMGEGTGAFAVIRDLTQQKQSDAKIMELNEELKSRIAQLEATNRELESFSYSVSHDLRAPLRHVLGFVDLLNSRASDALDEKSHHYLDVISEAARKMGHLIDDLLAFSRMGRAEMMSSRVDLGMAVREITRELSEEAKGREVEWVAGPLPEVVGDPSMLRQVMFNLLANALKFTRDRAHARIEVGAVDQDHDTHFYVRDNGVGFDPAYGNKLFGLFQRLHMAEEFEGTGVGLAIVQRIIARHGGRVWAEGALGEGATFWFSLPKR